MSNKDLDSQMNGVMGGEPMPYINGLRAKASSFLTTATSLLDRTISAKKRGELRKELATFSKQKPYLASFLLSQILISGSAILLFVLIATTVSICALLSGILIGLLGALLFILSTLGFALIILLPTLLFTTFAAIAIWFWVLCGYHMLKYFSQTQTYGPHNRPIETCNMLIGRDPAKGVQKTKQNPENGVIKGTS